MSACAVLRRIEKVSQRVANFLDTPGRLTPSVVNNLLGEIETVIGGVRNLPISSKRNGEFSVICKRPKSFSETAGSA